MEKDGEVCFENLKCEAALRMAFDCFLEIPIGLKRFAVVLKCCCCALVNQKCIGTRKRTMECFGLVP